MSSTLSTARAPAPADMTGSWQGTSLRQCASICSPASTRPRCTAAPASTSSTWPGACARWPTYGCTASARPRDRAGRDRRTPSRRGWPGPTPALRTLGVDLEMAAGCAGTDLVHSHTWYANLAGHLAKLLHGVPHVATAHSLEPLRPWKAEQLGGGYALSSWCERTALEAADAVIAVSAGMRRDVLRGLPGDRPGPGARRPQRHRHRAVRARPRHRRARAARHRPGPAERRLRRPDHPAEGAALPAAGGPVASRREAQLVLLAGAPDTPEIAAEVTAPRRRAARDPQRRGLGAGDAAQARGDPGPHARDGLRLPVHLRADGHRQPGGDGLRDGGGGDRHRRHPRGGGRRRRPGCWSRSNRRPTARHAARPGRASSPTWPRPSTNCWPTRPGPTAMGQAGPGRARSSTSPGRRSPSARIEVYRSVVTRMSTTAPATGTLTQLTAQAQ